MTPIDRLIDAAVVCATCGRQGRWACTCVAERRHTLAPLAEDMAQDILHDIDTMYPDLWTHVPRTARISLRRVIVSTVLKHLVVE
jgi:hypothetical protein